MALPLDLSELIWKRLPTELSLVHRLVCREWGRWETPRTTLPQRFLPIAYRYGLLPWWKKILGFNWSIESCQYILNTHPPDPAIMTALPRETTMIGLFMAWLALRPQDANNPIVLGLFLSSFPNFLSAPLL